MSNEDSNKKPETTEMEKGERPLFSEEEFEGVAGEAITGLEETQAQESVIRFGKISQVGGVGSTMVPDESQEGEIQSLLDAMGKKGTESPGQPLQAFVRSGGEGQEWTPASIVEAEKLTQQEIYAGSGIPMGIPAVRLPKPGQQASRILPQHGGIKEVLKEDGTSKFKAVPNDGKTLTAPMKKLETEAAAEERFFNTPPEGFPPVDEDGQRLGDTMVDVEPSWFNRNRGKATFGLMCLALLVGVGIVLWLFDGNTSTNITKTLTGDPPSSVRDQIEQVRLERLNPPTTPPSSEEGGKVAVVEPDPTAVYEGARDIAESIRDRAEEVLEGMPVTPKEKTPEAKVADKVAEAEEPTPEAVATPPVEEPVAVAKPEETSDELDFLEEKDEEKPNSMSLDEVFAVDLTKPRNKQDCYIVADRANSYEVGLDEGLDCCENLRKIKKGGVMASCRNLVRRAIEE